MSSDSVLDVVQRFVDRLNAQDPDGMAALMTGDHRFIDSMGTEVVGRERMRAGWAEYYRMVPDYCIEVTERYAEGDVVALFGMARGTYSPDGMLSPENYWETPAAWRARVRGGRIAEWRVYADNEPIRQRIAAYTGD